MDADFFIRTYEPDLEWLVYAIRSIHRFATGFSNIILCIPESQVEKLSQWHIDHVTRVVTCPVYEDDYLGQQISKLESYRWCPSQVICFFDSDMVLHTPITPASLMLDGCIEISRMPYANISTNQKVWQEITEKAFKRPVLHEYNQRAPFVVWRETLIHIQEWFLYNHGQTIAEYITAQPYRSFSEFNFLGAYATEYEPDRYLVDERTVTNQAWCDGRYSFARMFWSHGGLTDEVKLQLEEILRG